MNPENQKPAESNPSTPRDPSEAEPESETQNLQTSPGSSPPIQRRHSYQPPIIEEMPDPPEPSDDIFEPDLDYDFEEQERQRELQIEESADYNDNFSRSSDEGWFYSDED